jgi:hypothetical protein
MEPMTLKINDVQVTLRSVYRNKEYLCDCKIHSIRCDLREQLSASPSTEVLVATEAVFNIRNTSRESWPVQITNWELVDTDGYAYKARALCDLLRPPRTLEPSLSLKAADGSHVTQGTQVDFVLVFPKLEADQEIACILYSDREQLQYFKMKELKPEAIDLMQACEATRAEIPNREPSLRNFRYNFRRLERAMNSRLNKTLPRDKDIALENEVSQIILDIKQNLEFEGERTRKVVEEKLASVLEPYESKLAELKTHEEEKRKLDKTVEQLSELSGLEFEEWLADLLEELGFEKVTTTPSSNDEGIDILAKNKGLNVAIQCKHWKKKKVGRPEIQSFL